MKRTVYSGEVSAQNLNQELTVAGWIDSVRNHGGLVFVNIRDISGVVQTVFDESENKENYELAKKFKEESVVYISGLVRKRPDALVNKDMATGEIEILAKNIKIISVSKPLPIQLGEYQDASNDQKLKYRYLELRQKRLQNKILIRHKALQVVRKFLSENRYNEVETPLLIKSTPEGARDFLVPSRLHNGTFYALPQSPQTMKQILMISGFDKYFQIAKCFRDEDLRKDRQPEFTQIDIETSFLDQEDFLKEIEGLFYNILKDVNNIEIKTPFPIMPYDEAMDKYGVDKPDLRFRLHLADITEVFANTDFNVFKNIIADGGIIKSLPIKKADFEKIEQNNFTRKEIDGFSDSVKYFGFQNIAWVKIAEGEFKGSIAKFLKDEEKAELTKKFNLEEGDILFLLAGVSDRVNGALGELRNQIGEKLGLIDENEFNFVWIVDFPLFEYSADDDRYYAKHHPFTAPIDEHAELLLKGERLKEIKAKAYDIVCNGVEIGGGSQRIYDNDMQMAMFKALSIEKEEAEQKFGFLLEAFNYGVPPHGGIALGFDRMIMMLTGAKSIKDVIAFPKTNKAIDLMMNAPSEVDATQLKDLGINLINK